MKTSAKIAMAAAVGIFGLAIAVAATDTQPAGRETAVKLMNDGNYKDAYNVFSRLARDAKDDTAKVSEDLANGLQCLANLGRQNEIDEFLEAVIKAHEGNWRLLQAAAQNYLNIEHNGFIIAGQFERGGHRGGGRAVNAYERDRVRALQLLQQAMPLVQNESDHAAAGGFYYALAEMLLANRGFEEAWRFQYLSDLTTLPDYDEGYWYGYRGYGGTVAGAPVDEDGKPIYYSTPKSWQAAANDGQRWRWALAQAVEMDSSRKAAVRLHFAEFLHHQFGVQTMAQYDWFFRGRGGPTDDDDTKKDTSGTYELHTLGDDETIARLATGIRRFTLPEEFSFVRILKELTEDPSTGERALDLLGQIFEDRRQYPRAAEYWRQNIQRFGPGHDQWKQKRLDQIVGNWGMFDPIVTQPAGRGATVEYVFRNGQAVTFTAHAIKVSELLADVKAYIKTRPKDLNWQQVDIANLGWRLVEDNQQKYIGEQVAQWDMELKPRPEHFDRRVTVATPLQKAGAYLLTGAMRDGNTCKIILWVADTALVKKPLDGQILYYVADAVSGEPVAKANVEFFGYRQRWVTDDAKRGQGHHVVDVRDFAEFTDDDGLLYTKKARQDEGFQWLITATTDAGRLAYLGYTGAWFGQVHDAQYKAVKTFVMTDRPVYRPKQSAKFKFWVNRAQYDQEGRSPFAGQSFLVRVNNPKGEKVLEKTFTADEYGGFDGEVELPADAPLGMWQVLLPNSPHGGGSFRVEEYKKPEFEVTVDAPSEPVMLGEKITATITAKYYFGSPVTTAKVKYKVMRSSYSTQWYPVMPWDWFYGPGYWWFCYDYAWYPGWREWGCARPLPIWWWQWHPREQPEVVAEAESPIGPDGTVKVEIDSAVAKAIHGDTDHKYDISVEVTDQSRRTITGSGSVLAARKPFKVYAWLDRGHYRAGDVIHAQFKAQTLDRKPVKGSGELQLLKVTYKTDEKTRSISPVEQEVQKWHMGTNEEGYSDIQLKADQPGQYRLSYKVTDSKAHAIEGGYIFCITGEGFDGGDFRFADLELVPDKAQYSPGETMDLRVNTDRAGSTVLLFLRPADGVCLPPTVLRLTGKSIARQVEVLKKDMPNFFIEALTVSGGKTYQDVKEIVVPPEKRILNVKITPSAQKYRPGEKAVLKVQLTDNTGEPFVGSTVLTVYDKAVEYISGGSNVPEIKDFFWKWRRQHHPQKEDSLDRGCGNLTPKGQTAMGFLGAFGASVATEIGGLGNRELESSVRKGVAYRWSGGSLEKDGGGVGGAMPMPAAAAPMEMAIKGESRFADMIDQQGTGGEAPPVEPTVRTQFADTALWVAALTTDTQGQAEVTLTMPENLTTWKTTVWAMGDGTRVGQASTDVVTYKNLILRLQAPRFFTQKDEVVLSANVHNYLKTKKSVQVVLELEGGTLELMKDLKDNAAQRTIEVAADGEQRVDWRVKAVQPGEAVVRMKALTDEESDATEMKLPVYVHGMLKTESFSGVVRPKDQAASFTIRVPKDRQPDKSVLEIRYSPTLAGAMVDALPYLVSYPYGCTEQSLNRFVPTVITQKTLLDMKLNLKDIQTKRTNLNAQEIGDDRNRASDWGYRGGGMSRATAKVVEPVFDPDAVTDMVKAGVEKLTSMQNGDGGWGWFAGLYEQSWPHTTAVVVHGLQVAKACDVAIVPGVLDRGVAWLKQYQQAQVTLLINAGDSNRDAKRLRWKERADNLDALIYTVLVDAKADNGQMREFLYRDRNELSVYAKAMFALACHKVGDTTMRDMLRKNVEQYLVMDDENQTAYLKLPEGNTWWCWYGSEIEAHAWYLKLLAAVDPGSEVAPRLVKYLINNRKHATYWNSTRDTAYVVEAFADYLRASAENKPDMTLEIFVDGKKHKDVTINADNLFSFDNRLVLTGDNLTDGEHKVELRRKGSGAVYFNAYLTNFTLEDPITRAGLEIKVQRKFYKLIEADKKVQARGSRGQAVEQKVQKYERQPLENLSELTSGDLLEVELTIESKNDYEYILFEDMKAAGAEAVELRSGYNGNDLGAYMELRDERVTFFVRQLARGTHSVSYRLRAEIPGSFSALPTRASAMYAPELKANSDEMKLKIKD